MARPTAARGYDRWLAALGCLVVLGAALPAHGQDAAPPAARNGEAQPDGFLYEVRPAPDAAGAVPEARLYLFGTIHLGSARFALSPAVTDRLAGASRLALEADPEARNDVPGLIRALALYPPEDSLERHIPADLLERLERIAPRYHLTEERLLRMKPWMVATSLDVLELMRVGLSGAYGVDVQLADFARAHHIPVVEIEGFEAQLRLFDAAPPAVQLDELRQSLDEIEDGEAVHDAQDLIDGWVHADQASIEEALAQLRERDGMYARFLRDAVLGERNLGMADRAESYLALGGTTFFAVGTLHLFAANGLVSELTRRGYRVRRLQ